MHWKLHEINELVSESVFVIVSVKVNWGTIEMSFNNMWFLDSAPSEWKDIWNNLMKEAQRVYIEAKDNMIMYQYYYDLAVEVPCVQTQYK